MDKVVETKLEVIESIEKLKEHLNKLNQTLKVREAIGAAQYQLYYLQTIQEVITNNCSEEVLLSPTVYQTNIYANNWILGDQTINDVVNQYIVRSR